MPVGARGNTPDRAESLAWDSRGQPMQGGTREQIGQCRPRSNTQSTVTRGLRRLLWVPLAVLVTGCGSDPAPADPPPAPHFQPTTTIEDLMWWLIDPAADALWDAVVITSTPDGLEETRPETDEDWRSLERQTLILVEAGNLLQIDGRDIAGEDSVSELPGIDLEPAEIAERIAANQDGWLRSARELHDAGVVILEAVRTRDVDALLAGGDRLDVACENCHSRFWYPDAGESEPPPASP